MNDDVSNFTFKSDSKVPCPIGSPDEANEADYILQYFPASIIEKTDPNGTTHNDLRVFNPKNDQADIEIPDEAYIKELRKQAILPPNVELQKGKHYGPKMLFCITMYQEEWYQILQSIAGCIRSILELHKDGIEEYHPDKYGIILICGRD